MKNLIILKLIVAGVLVVISGNSLSFWIAPSNLQGPAHQQITFIGTTRIFYDSTSPQFNDKPYIFTVSSEFAQAQIVSANKQMDDGITGKTARFHCDDEELKECSEFVQETARQVSTLIATIANKPDKLGANDLIRGSRMAIGMATHTLQDFYSHSNWVELGNDTTINKAFIRDFKFKKTKNDACGPASSIPITDQLTSGYYHRNPYEDNSVTTISCYKAKQIDANYECVEDPVYRTFLPLVPPPSYNAPHKVGEIRKCIHGHPCNNFSFSSICASIILDKPIFGLESEGIAKDSSPRDFHQIAREIAIDATTDYINKILLDVEKTVGVGPYTDWAILKFLGHDLPVPKPDAPTNIELTEASSSGDIIELSFSSSQNATKYNLYKENEGSPIKLDTFSSTLFTYSGLEVGVETCFLVSAENEFGDGVKAGIGLISGEFKKLCVTPVCKTNDDCSGVETKPEVIYNPPGKPSGGAGDPHLFTADGLKFDLQLWGESIVLRSSVNDLEIQARTYPWRGSDTASVTTALAMNVNGDKVNLEIRGSELFIFINNISKIVTSRETLPNGGQVIKFASTYYVVWPDNSQIKIKRSSDHLNYTIWVAEQHQGKLSGILGNYDGNRQNELTSLDGQAQYGNVSFDFLYKVFGESWRITQEQSLFTYLDDENTETFTNRDFPLGPLTSKNLSNSIRDNAAQLCSEAGILDPYFLESCIIDVGITNESSFIDSISLAETDAADLGLGEQLVLTDYAVRFETIDDTIVFPTNLKGLGISDVFTLSFNVKADAFDDLSIMLEDGESQSTSALSLGLSPLQNLISLSLNTQTDSFNNDAIATSLLSGLWIRLSVVYDGSQISLFRDAELLLTESISGEIIDANAKLRIGVINESQPFKGSIDELSVWGEALSQSEISGLLDRSLVGNEQGLLAYWAFNRGNGGIATDLTGNGRNALMEGNLAWFGELLDDDGDGLSNATEVTLGTNYRNQDSDGDTVSDFEEVFAGQDGYITNPLNRDSDGDGVPDQIEIALSTSPINENDVDYAGAIDSIEVFPSTLTLISNVISPEEVGQQLRVIATLLDGSKLDLTSNNKGTVYDTNNSAVCNLEIANGFVYGAAQGTCEINITNGASTKVIATVTEFSPIVISKITVSGFANNVAVKGNTAFVAAGDSGMHIINMNPDRSELGLIGSFDTSGTAIDIELDGNLVYLADGDQGLKLIDVSDPATPELVGSLATPGIAQDISIHNGFAYIAAGSEGLVIVDVTDPEQPIESGRVNIVGDVSAVATQGNIAAIASSSGLFIVDIKNPSLPSVVGNLPLGNLRAVEINSDQVFVASANNGFSIINISDRAAPVLEMTSTDISPVDLTTRAKTVFFADQSEINGIPYLNLNQAVNTSLFGAIDHPDVKIGLGIDSDQQFLYLTVSDNAVDGFYGTSGDTSLVVSQYRTINDTLGNAPTVEISNPRSQDKYVQGDIVTADVLARDDVFVSGVMLLVNGEAVSQDEDPPYQLSYQIPANYLGAVDLSAIAFDISGNAGTSDIVTIEVVIDPKTTVIGSVVSVDGTPISEAIVVCKGQGGHTNEEGVFRLANVTTSETINCRAVVNIGGAQFLGISKFVEPIREGVTDVGQIQVNNVQFLTEIGDGLDQEDDDSDLVRFHSDFTFPYYGEVYSQVYVGSNGRLMFTRGDDRYTESLEIFLEQPNISAFFDDLDPIKGGDVFVRKDSDKLVVTWLNIPHYDTWGSNSIQLILYSDGSISIAFSGVTAQGAFVGLSNGKPLGATEINFSNAPFLLEQSVSIFEEFVVDSNNFDLDGNVILFSPNEEGYQISVIPLQ